MLITQLYSKLEKSEIFSKFKAENPDAFLCAGFFILNFKGNIYEYSFDFKNDKQIFTFKIPIAGEIVLLAEDVLAAQKPLEEIKLDMQVDINDLRILVEKELVKQGIKNKLEEIIAVLQSVDLGKDDSLEKRSFNTIWNLTCMCEGFTIITIQVDSKTGQVIKFEKKSLFDFAKPVKLK